MHICTVDFDTGRVTVPPWTWADEMYAVVEYQMRALRQALLVWMPRPEDRDELVRC